MFTIFIHYAPLLAQAIILGSLLLPAALYFVYCVKKALAKPLPESEEAADEKDYAIVVAINEKTQNLSSLCQALQQLNYTNYLVYVVMNANNAALVSSPHEKIIILHPPKPFADAVRTHRYAIENFRRPHTHLAVLGCHSLPDSEYLHELNVFFNQGYAAVQGLCVKANRETVFDVVHSLTRLCNSFFYSEVCFALGSSARLYEDGSAFAVSVYKQCLKTANTTGVSLSSALQHKIISKGCQIAFAPKAILYHQQCIPLHTLAKQHAKHTHVWFGQFGSHIRLCLTGVGTLSFNRFLFGLAWLQPPVFTSLLAGVLGWFIAVQTHSATAPLWGISLIVFSSYFGVAALHLRASHSVKKLLGGASHSASYPVPDLYEAEENATYEIAS